jgi:hypothetical protein
LEWNWADWRCVAVSIRLADNSIRRAVMPVD